MRNAVASVASIGALVLSLGFDAHAADERPGFARAASRENDKPAPQPAGEPSNTTVPPIAWVALVVPGLVLHGSGHFAAGHRTTAYRLAAIEASGVGLVLAGGVPLFLTGASRYVVGPAALAVVGGVGLFAMSFLSDVYGLVAPEGGTGAPLTVAPRIESRLGYMYVYDPQFAYRDFLITGADVRWASMRISPSAWFAADDPNERLRLAAAYRFAGPRPDRRATDGSYLELEAAATRHAFPGLDFTASALEVSVMGRLDFGRLDRRLRGSFAEMGAGVAARWVAYGFSSEATDVEDLLLARLGYGVYLGGPERNAGEILLYYDHRHDDFAAGLQIPGLASGVAGHFGLMGKIYAGEIGLGADFQAGSAYLASLSVLYRHPVKP